MNNLDVLHKIYKLFSNRNNWTQGANARKEDGSLIDPQSTEATCWCLNGAILKYTDVVYDESIKVLKELVDSAKELYPDSSSIIDINDGKSSNIDSDGCYQRIMTLLKHTINKLDNNIIKTSDVVSSEMWFSPGQFIDFNKPINKTKFKNLHLSIINKILKSLKNFFIR